MYDGATPLVTDAPLVSGQAAFTASGPTAPGDHTYRAVFTPADGSVFEASEADQATGYVKDDSHRSTEAFPGKVAKGAKAKGAVTVKQTAGGNATGTVKVKRGAKVVGQGTLKKGKVTLTLAKLPKGKNTLKIVYGAVTPTRRAPPRRSPSPRSDARARAAAWPRPAGDTHRVATDDQPLPLTPRPRCSRRRPPPQEPPAPAAPPASRWPSSWRATSRPGSGTTRSSTGSR